MHGVVPVDAIPSTWCSDKTDVICYHMTITVTIWSQLVNLLKERNDYVLLGEWSHRAPPCITYSRLNYTLRVWGTFRHQRVYVRHCADVREPSTYAMLSTTVQEQQLYNCGLIVNYKVLQEQLAVWALTYRICERQHLEHKEWNVNKTSPDNMATR